MKYEALLRAFSYTCQYGCYEYGFPSEAAALAAHDAHECLGMKA